MFTIYQAYTKELVCEYETREEVLQLVANCALKYNYGIYRKWCVDGHTYFDFSANVYVVDADLMGDNNA